MLNFYAGKKYVYVYRVEVPLDLSLQTIAPA